MMFPKHRMENKGAVPMDNPSLKRDMCYLDMQYR